MKSVKLYVENPTFKQRLILLKWNFFLWIASKVFKGKELDDERIELIECAYIDLKTSK